MGTAECTLQEQVKTLYTGHHGGLHGWLCHCLNDATDAADLAHNTFVRLVARPRSFNTGLESPACLRTVANGLCTDRQRHSEIEPAWLTLDIRPQEYAPPREAQASVLLTLHETDGTCHPRSIVPWCWPWTAAWHTRTSHANCVCFLAGNPF